MATAQERGYVFEDFTQGALKVVQEFHRGSFLRLYDTKSTVSGILPAQPADFIMWRAGKTLMIECKNSVEEWSMTRKYISHGVKKAQAAKMGIHIRAGVTGLYLFNSELSGHIEVWGGGHIVEVFFTPRMQPDPSFMLARFPHKESELVSYLLENTK